MGIPVTDFGSLYIQITDTTDDDARIKIHSTVVKHMSGNGMAPNFAFVPAEDSLYAGTRASEAVTTTDRAERLIIAVNYAPPDRKDGTENNHRKDFFCADLGDGVSLCGTSNGFEFSYLKNRIRNLFRLTSTNATGSQFRSHQVLVPNSIRFSVPQSRRQMIGEGILEPVDHIDDIVPTVPDITHAFQIDNFGNVKLYLSKTARQFLEREAAALNEISFAFRHAPIDASEVSDTQVGWGSPPIAWDGSKIYHGIAAPTMFKPPVGNNVVALTSSSTLSSGDSVPIIATLRDCPALTRPGYEPDLPRVGSRVGLFARHY